MKDRQPFEAASTFHDGCSAENRAVRCGAVFDDAIRRELAPSSAAARLVYEGSADQATAKMLSDMKADKKSAPPAKTPPPSDAKDAAQDRTSALPQGNGNAPELLTDEALLSELRAIDAFRRRYSSENPAAQVDPQILMYSG